MRRPRQRGRGARRLPRPGPARLSWPCSGAWGPTSPSSPGAARPRRPSGPRPGPLRATEVPRQRDPLARRGPRPGRGRRRRRGHDRLPRRRRAPGEGGRPAGRGGRPGRGLRGERHGSRATPGGHRPRRARCAALASTAAATTAWPWRRPSRRSRPAAASAASSPGSTPWRPATRGSPMTSERITGGRAQAPRPLLVAIDGPAGAGKSTVSTAVAERLGLDRLDTGAMYRAVAALALSERHRHPTTARRWPAWPPAATIEVGRAGHDRRPRRHRRHPLARGGPGGLDRGGQPRGAPPAGAAPARLGRDHGRGRGRGPRHRLGRLPRGRSSRCT